LNDCFAADQVAAPLDQQQQKLHRDSLELDGLAGVPKLVTCRPQLKFLEPKRSFRHRTSAQIRTAGRLTGGPIPFRGSAISSAGWKLDLQISQGKKINSAAVTVAEYFSIIAFGP
jgi:hypothetical protein